MGSFKPDRVALLVHWMVKREEARVNKEADHPKPYTDDPIVQTTRFCNVRRLDDRVSRWLLEHWYAEGGQSPKQILVNAGIARLINWPDTLQFFKAEKVHEKWNRKRATAALERAKATGKVFTGAYIINGLAGQDKCTTVLDQFDALHDAGMSVVDTTSMSKTHKQLQTLKGFGSFISGQVVADLRHVLPGEWGDRNTWAPKGPGSLRGMNWLLGWNGEPEPLQPISQPDFENMLRSLGSVLRSTAAWPIVVERRLEMHDLQNVLCETDKYLRLKFGTGRAKNHFAGTP